MKTNVKGCAFGNSSKVKDPTDKAMVKEHIEVLKQWPGAGAWSLEKTPTIIAYDNDLNKVLAWGSGVTDNHKIQFAHFKLLLQQTTELNDEVDNLKTTLQEISIIRSSGLPRGKTAVNVTADYLREVHRFLHETLRSTYGEEYLSSQKLLYVITVPAMWSDRSKALTEQAAREAGFTGKLTLVTEPEAAALYCATICEEVDLKVGSKFLGTPQLPPSICNVQYVMPAEGL